MTLTSTESVFGRNSVRNMLSNYVSLAVTVMTGLLLTPFVLAHLGPTGYGVWALVGSVLAYGTMLDFGISSAVVKYIAEYRQQGVLEHTESLVATAFWAYVSIGVLAVAFGAVVAFWLPTLLQVPPDQQQSTALLALLSGAIVGVSLPCALPAVILRGLQRFDLLNILASVATLLNAAFSVGVLLLGGGVVSLAVLTLVLGPVVQVLGVWLVHRALPELGFRWRRVSPRRLHDVLGYSAPIAIMQFAGRLQSRTDEFVIGAFLPVAAITPYSVSRRLSEMTLLVSGQFIRVLMPRVSEMHAGQHRAGIRMMFLTSTRLSLAIFVPIGGTLGVLASPILTLWLGSGYAEAEPIVRILLLVSLFYAAFLPAASVLQGIARHRVLAIAALASGIANILLSVLLVRWLGLEGVALGTLIPTAIETVVVVLPWTLRILGISLGELVQAVLVPALVPALPMVVLLQISQLVFTSVSLGVLACQAALAVLVYTVGFMALARGPVETELRHLLLVRSAQVARAGLRMSR